MKSHENIEKNSPGVYLEPPQYFNAHLTSCACFIKFKNKILLLQKALNSWSPTLWGIPCGRKEENENIYNAIIRELKEEIGVEFPMEKIKYLGKLFIIQNDLNHNIHNVFYLPIEQEICVTLSNEHMNYIWVSKEEISAFDLIPNQNKVISFFKIFEI